MDVRKVEVMLRFRWFCRNLSKVGIQSDGGCSMTENHLKKSAQATQRGQMSLATYLISFMYNLIYVHFADEKTGDYHLIRLFDA